MKANLSEILHRLFPKEMAKFDENPYDYKVFGPLNLDEDEAITTIILNIGKDGKKTESYRVELNMYNLLESTIHKWSTKKAIAA